MSIKLTLDDDALISGFKSLSSLEDIAMLLDVPDRTLRFFLYKKHVYRTFEIAKRAGGTRKIQIPANGLKIVQRKLNQVLHAVYRARSPVHGFVKGRSVRSNAARHLGAEWILNIDLENFFSSINFGRVQGLFGKKPYGLPHEAATVLAHICCHQGMLPTGAPTSPIIANMICGRLDSDLKKLARENGCIYTRYADDITFSTRSRRFSPSIALQHIDQKTWKVGDQLLNILTQNGFAVNHGKTRVRGRHTALEVTGVRINDGLNVPKALYRQVRAMLHAWEKFGEDAAEVKFWTFHDRKSRNELPAFRTVLRGKIEYIGFIRGRDHNSYIRLLDRLQQLQSGFHFKPIWTNVKSEKIVLNRAIWLLYNHQESEQGSAFAISQKYLLTTAHCVNEIMFASRPSESDQKYLLNIEWRDDELDLAIVSTASHIPITLEIASRRPLQTLEPVTLLGYPNHHKNDGVGIRHGKITQTRYYAHVLHYIIDADIVKGNSGGPILDNSNRVIGVAVKGVGVPGAYGEKDQLSSFVPIDAELISEILATL